MTDDVLTKAIRLPDGCLVRGRGLRRGLPDGPAPEFGLYLGTAKLRRRHEPPWPRLWIDWPDFLVPRDFRAAVEAINDLHERANAGERVEVACGGGVGRTGTVIACLAVLSGLSASEALTWTREHHHPRAVETPWQRRWITRFSQAEPPPRTE